MFDVLTGQGLIQLPWWGYLVAALVLCHLTIVCVTLFLHRSQAHRSVDFHPAVSHLMRLWLWLATGMNTKEWVAIHRKHHARCETPDDPHSPAFEGILTVLLRGADLYRDEARNAETLRAYGRGTPKDALEKHLYSRFPTLGILLMLALDYIVFGFFGIALWAVQMMWIPFFAAGVVNGVGHYGGYRNFATDDNSTNFSNLGLLIGGEELHNNHHAFPTSAKFSFKWWEFDIGWLYIRLLRAFGLARILRLAPVPRRRAAQAGALDLKTAAALFHSRLHVMREYAASVIVPVIRAELAHADSGYRKLLLHARRVMLLHDRHVSDQDRDTLKRVLDANRQLEVVYEFKRKLHELWSADHGDQHRLCDLLHEWCRQAEETGLQKLADFSRRIQGYTLKPSLAAIHHTG